MEECVLVGHAYHIRITFGNIVKALNIIYNLETP